MKDIDTSIFPFGKQPFENLKNSIQNSVLTVGSASNEQYFFVYSAIFDFLLRLQCIILEYILKILLIAKRVFFFSVEGATIKSIFEQLIQITGMGSYTRLYIVTDCDVELPYLTQYMADARNFYWGNYAFFEDLYIHLGDDISRHSMKMFLHKNILCQSLSAFIGDTTIYFAGKVGKTGKVYGFEVFEESINSAEKNIEQNNCSEQCEILHLALSDKRRTLSFNLQKSAFANSTALNWSLE